MKKRIKDFADIQIGYHFDKKIVSDPNGSHYIIQMRDIDDWKSLNASSLMRVTPDRDVSRYQVKKGDVLFISRGNNNNAVVIDFDVDNAVPVSHFFIVRITTDSILPSYLAWYINQPSIQAILKKDLQGSNIPMIRSCDFLDFSIEFPDLQTQNAIVELDRLNKRESSLHYQLAEKKSHLVNSICMKAIRADKNMK